MSNTRSLVNKIDELSSTVPHYLADFIAIRETWLPENISCTCIDLPGFSVLRHDRSDGRRGGRFCVFVKDQFPLIHIKPRSSESLWLLLKWFKHYLIILCIIYPPGSEDIALQNHIYRLSRFYSYLPSKLCRHQFKSVPPSTLSRYWSNLQGGISWCQFWLPFNFTHVHP